MTLDPVFVGDPLPAALNEERGAINDLQEGLATKISLPAGAATGDLLRWSGVEWETTETRFFEGEGRPDGVFAAPIGSRYIDKTATQGAVEWVKRSGGEGNTGWLCLAGDTGLRNIASLIDIGNGTVNQAIVSRIGSVVDMHLDLTMPSNRGTDWTLISSFAGFTPGYNRFASLQPSTEIANDGSVVQTNGAVVLFSIISGKRDRFSGSWLTRDAWPAALPGAAF